MILYGIILAAAIGYILYQQRKINRARKGIANINRILDDFERRGLAKKDNTGDTVPSDRALKYPRR